MKVYSKQVCSDDWQLHENTAGLSYRTSYHNDEIILNAKAQPLDMQRGREVDIHLNEADLLAMLRRLWIAPVKDELTQRINDAECAIGELKFELECARNGEEVY